jgi:hypothetical protein
MPGKHLGKIHSPIFLLKKSGLYLWYCVSVQAKIVADSAQTANSMWQIANFWNHTFDLLCCQFYIIQAVHLSLYSFQPTFHFILHYSCKMCFLPLEASFSKQWNTPKMSNSFTILAIYFYEYKECSSCDRKNELIRMICLFQTTNLWLLLWNCAFLAP